MRTESYIRGQRLPKPELCDCGHAPTPDSLSTGYATDRTGRHICYACAADADRAYAATMTRDDTPLMAFVTPWPGPAGTHSERRVSIITWPGVKLGHGFKARTLPGNARAFVEAWIDGRHMWGWTPTENGSYVALRPYKEA